MKGVVTVLVGLWLLVAPSVGAAAQPVPEWWQRDGAGGFFGVTADGQAFTHTPVPTVTETRLNRFVWADQSWYVSDRGVIWATNDLTALSIYLTRTV